MNKEINLLKMMSYLRNEVVNSFYDQNQTLETANLGVVSKLEGGKVVLTTTLTKIKKC